MRAVKTRPIVFLPGTVGQVLSLFFSSFSHLFISVTEEHILSRAKNSLDSVLVLSYRKTRRSGSSHLNVSWLQPLPWHHIAKPLKIAKLAQQSASEGRIDNP